MSARTKKEVFLTELLSVLRSQYPEWNVRDHCKIAWRSQPEIIWPQADLLIPERRVIVECDENSDPGRSLTKYWPLIDLGRGGHLTVIEVWKRGPTFGFGFAEIAKWMGRKLMRLYPSFRYEFIERRDETADTIAKQIAQIVKQI